jgi:maleate isomerase
MTSRLAETVQTMQSVKKIGHITPSCNTVLEHVTAMMASSLAHRVSNHFTRITVGNISLSEHDRRQFEPETMVAAAHLLTDAFMDVVLWNGTSACWNGTEADIEICEAITRATGVVASTTTLAQYYVFERYEMSSFGLAVPYTDEVTAKTIETFGQAGYEAVAHANLGLTVGRDMANVPLSQIKELIRAADSPAAECVIVVCTGLPAALVVEEMERELGKPIFDSVVVTLWKGLQLVGITEPIDGWGCLMRGSRTVDTADPVVTA